jgi:sugar phosphate permease
MATWEEERAGWKLEAEERTARRNKVSQWKTGLVVIPVIVSLVVLMVVCSLRGTPGRCGYSPVEGDTCVGGP